MTGSVAHIVCGQVDDAIVLEATPHHQYSAFALVLALVLALIRSFLFSVRIAWP